MFHNYNKISIKSSKIALYQKIWYLRKKFSSIILAQRKYKKIIHLLRQNKHTKTTNFIEKYHKNKKVWTNKIAYLAGIIDGEGYFKVEKHGTLRCIIGMCDKKTIYWIKNNFGGNVKIGKTAKGRKFYVWRMNQGKDLFYLLLCLIPFLVNKKKTAIKFFNIIINKIKKLEHTLYPFNFKD